MTVPTRNNLQATRSESTASNYTLAGYTPSSGSGRVLIVRASIIRTNTSSVTMSATFGGVSMTEAVPVADTSTSRYYRTSIFYLINPSTSAGDIVVSTSASSHGCIIVAVTLLGADTSSLIGATATDSDASATETSLALTGCAADSLILAAVSSDSAGVGTPSWSWTTATEDYDSAVANDSAEVAGSGGYYAVTSAGNVTLTATRSGAANRVIGAAAEFKAAPPETGEGQPFLARTRLVPGMGQPHGWTGW